jgi:hypothetical protein
MISIKLSPSIYVNYTDKPDLIDTKDSFLILNIYFVANNLCSNAKGQ